jgi:hypothetical protein
MLGSVFKLPSVGSGPVPVSNMNDSNSMSSPLNWPEGWSDAALVVEFADSCIFIKSCQRLSS